VTLERQTDTPRDLTFDEASRALTRAAQLDADGYGTLSTEQLFDVAREAGINQRATERAIDEVRQHAIDSDVPMPWWVRVGSIGVPDRPAMIRYYWLFAAFTCATPALLFVKAPPVLSRTLVFGSLAFGFFALWSTSCVVRWFDRHGWNRLR
jgi:hypothetical protein